MHWPSGDDDVFTFDRATVGFEIIEDGLWTDRQAASVGLEGDKNIHIQRGDRFKIERRAGRAADGVALNDAVSLHLVDRRKGVFDVHDPEVGRQFNLRFESTPSAFPDFRVRVSISPPKQALLLLRPIVSFTERDWVRRTSRSARTVVTVQVIPAPTARVAAAADLSDTTAFPGLLLRPIVPLRFGCTMAVSMIEMPVFRTNMNSADPFETIVNEHYEALYRFASSLTRADADARDLTQHTFYVWATKGHQLRDVTKVKTWLYTTLHRAFLQGRRRRSRFPEQELDEAIEQLRDVALVSADRLDALQVLPALAQLDEIYQAAVALFYLEDYAYKDIAAILDVPVGTVKSRIARGIAQLREILLSDGVCASTPLKEEAKAGALVPVPVWNRSMHHGSHLCHGHV